MATAPTNATYVLPLSTASGHAQLSPEQEIHTTQPLS